MKKLTEILITLLSILAIFVFSYFISSSNMIHNMLGIKSVDKEKVYKTKANGYAEPDKSPTTESKDESTDESAEPETNASDEKTDHTRGTDSKKSSNHTKSGSKKKKSTTESSTNTKESDEEDEQTYYY